VFLDCGAYERSAYAWIETTAALGPPARRPVIWESAPGSMRPASCIFPHPFSPRGLRGFIPGLNDLSAFLVRSDLCSPPPSLEPASRRSLPCGVLQIPQTSNPYSSPNSFQRFVMRRFTSSDISTSSGHGRSNPSVDHLRVASMPILLPKFASLEAWSSESTGPSVN